MTRRYESPEAFKQALEARVRRVARDSSLDMGRLRQILVFDRFLARVFEELQDRVVLKGGVVLEFRLERARTTRDVDLRVTGDPDRLLESLQSAGRRDLADYLSFLVVPDAEHPTIEGDAMVYDGRRFRGEARLAGNIYGMPFGIDAGFGDVLTSDPDIINGTTFLEFIDVKPAKFRVYPREAHVAEKLHAYTLPRPRENSRVKDLPDLALLGQTGAFEAESLRHAVQTTFAFRKTHTIPARIPSPPTSWGPIYSRMAKEDALPWSSIDALERVVRGFLDPLLGNAGGTWDPKNWTWSSMT